MWTFAAHYPEKTVAVAGLAVPYHTLELGMEEAIKYVDREVYPADEYPFGQWSYMNFYEQDFEKATGFFDADIPGVLRAFYAKKPPTGYGKPAFTSTVTKDGGWFGGAAKPDPALRNIPDLVIEEDMYKDLVAAMEKTGFWAADAWYSNHKRNRAYSLEKWKHGGHLHMPVLFIEAQFDSICDTAVSRLSEPMRKYCSNLTECSIDAGHWVAEEKPEQVNAAIARWILESSPQHWPGRWKHAHVKKQK